MNEGRIFSNSSLAKNVHDYSSTGGNMQYLLTYWLAMMIYITYVAKEVHLTVLNTVRVS